MRAAITVDHATVPFLEGYFFIKSSAAAVIATIPVRIVGSGTGANLLECKLGSREAPGFFDSAILAGSTAPTWKSTAGTECPGGRAYSEKSSHPMAGSNNSWCTLPA